MDTFFIFLIGEVSLHFALGIIFRTHFINVIVNMLYECFFYKSSFVTKHLVVMAADYPAIIGVALLIALNYMIINTVVDILYGIIDPRVRCN